MKTLKPLLLAFAIIASYSMSAQVAVTTDGSSAAPSAMLEVKSTTKGFLPPRMTLAQRNAISSPATGLIIYQTDGIAGLYQYNGTWVPVSETADGAETKVTAGNNVSVTGTGTTGNPYVINSTAGVLAFAEFYALMPGDNAATVAPGAAIEFPQNGHSSGAITRSSATQFLLSNVGAYMVSWQVSISESGQLALELNNILIPSSVVGRATGTTQITGISLIITTTSNSVLRVINPAGNPTALTVTPLAGGFESVSASLVIMRIQ